MSFASWLASPATTELLDRALLDNRQTDARIAGFAFERPCLRSFCGETMRFVDVSGTGMAAYECPKRHVSLVTT